jgi:hypothetical protein
MDEIGPQELPYSPETSNTVLYRQLLLEPSVGWINALPAREHDCNFRNWY